MWQEIKVKWDIWLLYISWESEEIIIGERWFQGLKASEVSQVWGGQVRVVFSTGSDSCKGNWGNRLENLPFWDVRPTGRKAWFFPLVCSIIHTIFIFITFTEYLNIYTTTIGFLLLQQGMQSTCSLAHWATLTFIIYCGDEWIQEFRMWTLTNTGISAFCHLAIASRGL